MNGKSDDLTIGKADVGVVDHPITRSPDHRIVPSPDHPMKWLATGHWPLTTVLCCLLLTSCAVGPNYHRPTAPVPETYKESPPEGWKQAQPNEGVLRGKWWEIYNDPQLNALEEQVSISNQNVLVALAQYREARDTVRIARASYFPVLSTAPSASSVRTSSTITSSPSFAPGARADYTLPVDFSYQADIWGSIRRSVAASYANAQVSAADLENARLTYQAELAEFYFELHGQDGDEDLLERTLKAYQDYLQLTQDRYKVGVASGADVAQAETQLDTTRTQLIDLEVQRTQFEHAIAILIGKPPAGVSLPRVVLKTPPPPIPVGLPSTLLERRPDIAADERLVAAANEQIGIAKAAFFPTLVLSASGGFESASLGNWFTWPSRFWSLGPQLAETLFEGGKRSAQLDQQRAAYDATVAAYRQTVLTAFQQVEDNLAALRILEQEAAAADKAVRAAEDSLAISTAQYKAGTADYLQVITAQTAALQNERTAVDILTRRLTASVLLIEGLGGGWNTSQLPTDGALRQVSNKQP
jgi:NodT family efflux transporter outer membrane factor (OMF) lipoprotein